MPAVPIALLLPLTEQGPAPEDVKAGWLGFVVFAGLVLAVVFLGFSLVKQLRKAQAAQDAGVYGDPDVPPARRTEPDGTEPDATGPDGAGPDGAGPDTLDLDAPRSADADAPPPEQDRP